MILEMLAWLAFLVIGARLAIIDIAEHRLPNRLVILLAAGSTALLAGASLVSADPGRFMRAMACGMLVFCTMFVLAV
ncbi:MAG: prepilin peptidase, partial [Actinobacteria bacterium]|nr:prepilin peptidase [Actinomycetota bacterium]